MVVDDRRDHSFRVPRPEVAEKTGSPLSCLNCHADQSPAWARTAIAEYAGTVTRPEFASALAAGAVGYANPALIEVATDTAFPGIASTSPALRRKVSPSTVSS